MELEGRSPEWVVAARHTIAWAAYAQICGLATLYMLDATRYAGEGAKTLVVLGVIATGALLAKEAVGEIVRATYKVKP